jgi:hypothetical protein
MESYNVWKALATLITVYLLAFYCIHLTKYLAQLHATVPARRPPVLAAVSSGATQAHVVALLLGV